MRYIRKHNFYNTKNAEQIIARHFLCDSNVIYLVKTK